MAETPSRAIMRFGTDEPAAGTRLLTAGPLTAEFDAGNLRYIRHHGREAIRAISYVVRDELWGTFNPDLRDLEVEETGDRFTVTYAASCSGDKQRFDYRARITGSADGTLRFEGIGTPATDFLTNRTGFVVLHGVEGISGHPVVVTEVDGTVVETRFPEVIDPKQPIMNIRALTHEVAPGLKVTCTMLGDTFEMEDQRNWTDASYKTYVRPLELPHPYTLKTGETIEQAVELRFESAAPTSAPTSASGPVSANGAGTREITVTTGAEAGRIPQVAMGLEWQSTGAATARTESLAGLRPAYLSCYFDARHAGPGAMRGFRAVGEALGCHLALEAVLPGLDDPGAALRAIADMADAAGARFGSVAVSPAGDLDFVLPGTVFDDMSPYDPLYAAAREAFPESVIGGGNFMYFTELNRKPPPSSGLDFVIHPTCAIVHAADDRSVTETVETLPYIIRSVRSRFGGKPYCLGPVGIGTRTSPFGGPPPPNPHGGRVAMCRNDPRQRGLLGAAWHLGVAARAAEGGVESLILGAPTGAHGLLHHPGDAPQPWFDAHGGRFPAWHVMRAMYAASGRARRATEISVPREVQALAFETEAGGLELWVANLMGEERRIRLEGTGSATMRVAILDEESFVACAEDPDALDGVERVVSSDHIELRPYAVARCRAG
ncbi:MAG: hypothetical protein OXC65_14820 [Thiotrichales bacterium]|nr:hypothetical protein [Thiotrichales bacterium]